MTDKNINLCDTENEIQRYAYSMLPTYLLTKGTSEVKGFIRKATRDLPKKPYKQKVRFAQIFNELATTQTYPSIGISDLKTQVGELSDHPYEYILRSFGAEKATELLTHTKVIDSCLSQKFNEQLITNFKNHLFDTFNHTDNELNVSMTAKDFYDYLAVSFIAHLDAYIHNTAYSKTIAPISLGWLFMHKLDPAKWEYDLKSEKHRLVNKNGSPFTCTSRSFIHFLLTILYSQTNCKMPERLYGIRDGINWCTDDKEGHLYDFLDTKSERDPKRNWVSLEDLFWLLGMENSRGNDANEVLASWQVSMTTYIKTQKIDDLRGLPISVEGVIWFIYAFFQNIYEQTYNLNKKTKEQNFFIYDEYYDLWESMTYYYESRISEEAKNKRAEWPDYLKKQATRTERMA